MGSSYTLPWSFEEPVLGGGGWEVGGNIIYYYMTSIVLYDTLSRWEMRGSIMCERCLLEGMRDRTWFFHTRLINNPQLLHYCSVCHPHQLFLGVEDHSDPPNI